MLETIIKILEYVFTFGRSYYLEKREQYLLKCMNDEISIISTLELIGRDTKADRVSLVYMHNGGGKIAPGVEKHIKISNEISVTGKIHTSHHVSSTKVDSNHIVEMCQMFSSKWQMKLFSYKELCSQIYGTCVNQDKQVKQKILVYIGDNSKYMWYISIAYADETLDELSDDLRATIDENRSRIMTILKDYFKITRK